MAQSPGAPPPQLMLLRNSCCAGFAAATATGMFNPLDTLRVRWQLSPVLAKGTGAGTPPAAVLAAQAESTSLVSFAGSIVKADGFITGLWRPGLVATMTSMGTSCGIRMGCYPFLRDWAVGDSMKTPFVMFATGLVAGGVGYWVACPLFQTKTRLQAATLLCDAGSKPKQGSMRAQFQEVWSEGGGAALWRGAGPLVIRGALFSAGQTFGYDGTKTFLAQKRKIMEDGPVLHLLGSVVAAFFATTFSAPADFVLVRYQSAFQTGTAYSGPLECVRTILKEEGPQVLYRGWVPYFARVVPVFLTFHPLFEQFRVLAGLNYLT